MKCTQIKLNVHGQRKKLGLPNAKDTNMLVFLALCNAKVLPFALGDAKVPNANDFAFWWNIGLKVPCLCRKQGLVRCRDSFAMYNFCHKEFVPDAARKSGCQMLS